MPQQLIEKQVQAGSAAKNKASIERRQVEQIKNAMRIYARYTQVQQPPIKKQLWNGT